MRYGLVIDLKRCVGCGACALACKQANGTPPGVWWNKVLREEKGKYPNARISVLPVICNHCKNPSCVNVCPTGASSIREDGIVIIDQDKCIGCRACMTACSYNARAFNYSKETSYHSDLGESPHEKVHKTKHKKGTVEKCNFCMDRVDNGDQPFCVKTCPAEARIFGDIDDTNSAVAKLIPNSYQLHPEKETSPSVYYLSE